jgi:hypothetical protein
MSAPAGAATTSIPAYTQGIRNPIDIVKPRGNQRYLQDGPIVKAGAAQLLMMILRKPGSILCQLGYVIEHEPLPLRNRSSPVVLLQGLDQLFVQGDATQKLCVRLDSIMTSVGDRDDCGDHLMLSSGERQIR